MTEASVDLNTKLTMRSDCRHRSVGDEGVVVVQSAGEVIVVNGVGSRILELLDGNLTTGDLVAQLADEYDVDRDTLASDVNEYLSELSEASVVQTVS